MNLTRLARRSASFLFLLFLLPLLFSGTAAAETVIKVGGTGSALGVMRLLGAAYERSHPGVTIKVLPSLGSTAGVKALLANAIDIGLTSRPLKEDELRQGARETAFARTPFVFVTNIRVSKKGLTSRELEEAYYRPDATWPDGSRVRLVLRPEQDTDSTLIGSISPAMAAALKAAHSRPGMIMAITDQETTETIIKTPGSLGAATLAEILSEKLPLNILMYNGVKPGITSLADKTYPLVKTLYLATTPGTPAEAVRFAEFIRSPAAARILRANGCQPTKTAR